MGIPSNKGQGQGSECVQKVKTAGEKTGNSLWSMDVHNIPQKQPKWTTPQTAKGLPVLSTVQHINRTSLMQNSAGSASTQREQESMLLSSATTDGFFVSSGGVKNNSNLGQFTASRTQQCADVQLWIA
jgi:pyridoxal biosynthesis lyase PdxS